MIEFPSELTTQAASGDTHPNAVDLLLADKRSPQTRRAYRVDLCDFFSFEMGRAIAEPPVETVRAFVALPPHEIALRLAAYKAHLLRGGLSESTINRRFAAIRALLKLSFRLGFSTTDGRNLIEGERVRGYRDTRGIDLEALRRLVELPDTATVRGLRDTALLRVLAENALRRSEVVTLNVADYDGTERRLSVRGKGRGTQRTPVTLSTRGAAAIDAYLAAAGHAAIPGAPLFRSHDPRPEYEGERLTVDGLYYLIVDYGNRLGVKLTPHKLRHSAITAALDATNGDVRRVQRLSRHARLETLMIYDDNRSDLQGEVTGLLSDLLEE